MDKNKVKGIMKFNEVEKLFGTSDGEFFIDKNSAQNHALRLHGTKREKALNVFTVTAEEVGVTVESYEPTKEELNKEYDELFARYEKAETSVKEKDLAFKEATKKVEDAKGTDKEDAMIELVKKARTALKTVTTKKDNIFANLEKVEAKIEKFED